MDMLNPKIEWQEKSGRKFLRFTFKDKLTEQNAVDAIKVWRAAFAARMGARIPLIWDCLEMSGYDTASRVQWQQTLKDLSDQIETIWLISDSRIIRMGASVMALFSSLNIKAIDSEDSIIVGSVPPHMVDHSKQKST